MFTHNQSIIMEITVISAQGLKSPSSSILFSHRRLRPFITVTAVSSATSTYDDDDDRKCHVYKTRVDEEGGTNPTWGDKFRLPLHPTFFTHRSNNYSSVYLHLFSRRLIAGDTQLGSCQIPVVDIGFPPSESVRYLSYRLRARDGTRTHGVVNLAVKLEGSLSTDTCQTAIGIPVTAIPRGIVTCEGGCDLGEVVEPIQIQWFG